MNRGPNALQTAKSSPRTVATEGSGARELAVLAGWLIAIMLLVPLAVFAPLVVVLGAPLVLLGRWAMACRSVNPAEDGDVDA